MFNKGRRSTGTEHSGSSGAKVFFNRFQSIVDSGKLFELGAPALRVYLKLMRHADNFTGDAYPTVSSIADVATNGNRRATQLALRELEKNGFIARVGSVKQYKGATRYRLLWGADPQRTGGAESEHDGALNGANGGADFEHEGALNGAQGGAELQRPNYSVTTQETTHTTEDHTFDETTSTEVRDDVCVTNPVTELEIMPPELLAFYQGHLGADAQRLTRGRSENELRVLMAQALQKAKNPPAYIRKILSSGGTISAQQPAPAVAERSWQPSYEGEKSPQERAQDNADARQRPSWNKDTRRITAWPTNWRYSEKKEWSKFDGVFHVTNRGFPFADETGLWCWPASWDAARRARWTNDYPDTTVLDFANELALQHDNRSNVQPVVLTPKLKEEADIHSRFAIVARWPAHWSEEQRQSFAQEFADEHHIGVWEAEYFATERKDVKTEPVWWSVPSDLSEPLRKELLGFRKGRHAWQGGAAAA